MNVSADALRRYLRTRSASGTWTIEGYERRDFAGAVVIPSLAEGESLFATLESLAANPPGMLDRFLIVVVINHRQDAGLADKEQNRRDLKRLKRGDFPAGLHLAWVDATSPGRELPLKGGGVGLARKIGFDLALSRPDWSSDPVLVSLDADTLVESTYLSVILDHFDSALEGGAVIPFRHRAGRTPGEEEAIRRYELFLRHYVLGLSVAGSPYAYHSVGSAIAFRAESYVRAGGMNRRTAGEDFYFLQQLAKTSGVSRLAGTTVHPSSRPSSRTPFGTGRSVDRLLRGERDAVLFYPPETFSILGDWLRLATGRWQASGESLLEESRAISAGLAGYLGEEEFPAVWDRLRQHHKREKGGFIRAFHGWFDALRSLRLIHHLCAGEYPRVEPGQTLPQLMVLAGLEPATCERYQLELLRNLQR